MHNSDGCANNDNYKFTGCCNMWESLLPFNTTCTLQCFLAMPALTKKAKKQTSVYSEIALGTPPTLLHPESLPTVCHWHTVSLSLSLSAQSYDMNPFRTISLRQKRYKLDTHVFLYISLLTLSNNHMHTYHIMWVPQLQCYPAATIQSVRCKMRMTYFHIKYWIVVVIQQCQHHSKCCRIQKCNDDWKT